MWSFIWFGPLFARQAGGSESPHVLQVPSRESSHGRELFALVLREPVHHLAAPSLFLLARQDLPTDSPVEEHQFAIDREHGAQLGWAESDPLLDPGKKAGVARARWA